MKRVVLFLALCGIISSGCTSNNTASDDKAGEKSSLTQSSGDGSQASENSSKPSGDSSQASENSSPPSGDSSEASKNGSKPAGDGFALTSKNTKIEFIGTHVGARPNPRKGGFKKFSGSIGIDKTTGKIKSIHVTIETKSLWTEINRLTNHLKSPDFFDVRQFPDASFVSSKIAAGKGDQVTVTGNFTLHGVTKEISFPATVTSNDKGLTLKSTFQIDRTQFGMTFMPNRVEKMIDMSILVGS